MSTFKDFYNGLDLLNLILFWGTVVVIILIIIFLILYFSRKKTINNHVKEVKKDYFDDVDIIRKKEVNNASILNDNNVSFLEPIISDDKDFFAEDDKEEETIRENIELTVNENNVETKELEKEETISEDAQLNVNEIDITKQETKEAEPLFEDFIPQREDRPRAYQKNVFREMNVRNQTSPIGIVYDKKDNSLEEYHESFKEDNSQYLNDVYNSLENTTVPDKIELTDYERKQEEEAVISYSELLKKKDSINYDSDEEAVISYSELLDRKNKLYNIREEEEDKEFLSELKKFRRDL